MEKRPAWWEAAVTELLGGATLAAAARKLNLRRETLSRQGAALRAEVERRRAAAAPAQSEQDLAAKAIGVIEQALASGDAKSALDAAKAALVHVSRTQAAAPPEAPAEPEITEAQALEELTLSLPAIADLARMGKLPADLVEQFRAACRAFLADDLKPRPPLDVEAERVDMTPPPEQPAASSPPAGSQVIPLLN